MPNPLSKNSSLQGKKHLTSSTNCGKINMKQGKENPTNQKGFYRYEEDFYGNPR